MALARIKPTQTYPLYGIPFRHIVQGLLSPNICSSLSSVVDMHIKVAGDVKLFSNGKFVSECTISGEIQEVGDKADESQGEEGEIGDQGRIPNL